MVLIEDNGNPSGTRILAPLPNIVRPILQVSINREIQRYTETTHDPLLFSVAQSNILTVHRETLTQYITFKRGERGESVLLYSVALQL